MGDLLGEDFDLVQKDNLYRCLDKLLAHKTELFSFLQQRWKTLFEAKFEVLLYDVTARTAVCSTRRQSGGMAIAGTNAPTASRSSSL